MALNKLLPKTLKQVLKNDKRSNVTVNGWIRTVRHQKKVSFAQINDGSVTSDLQVVLKPELAKMLNTGCSVRMNGNLVQHKNNPLVYELKVMNLHIFGDSDGSKYPIQPKEHSNEFLRDHAHLRSRTWTTSSVIRIRDQLTYLFHSWFRENSFMNVQPPIITSSDCEGAGEVFEVRNPSSVRPFFGRDAYLSVSSQLHLEAITSGISRAYTLSPTFRAEGSQTNRHLSEFWMLEAEMSFVDDLESIMSVVELSVKHSMTCLISGYSSRQDLLHLRSEVKSDEKLEDQLFLDKQWPRMPYTEAIRLLELRHAKQPFEYEPRWGRSLQSEHERYLADKLVGGPLFVTDYPKDLKPFYMRNNDDGKTVSCFDLLVPGLGELAGGSLREERLEIIESKINEAGMNKDEYDWYLDLRRYGSVCHGGYGIGYERLISFITSIPNLRDIVLYPRWAGKCDF